MAKITFILGGVRSGKSAFAEQLAVDSGLPKIYLATAEAGDAEISQRITAHRNRRGDGWQTIEEPIDIVNIITSACHPAFIAGSVEVPRPRDKHGVTILVDCLTLWLSNLLHYNHDIEQKTEELIEALKATKNNIILVSSEVGQGVIPDNALARQFVDAAGILHQKIASVADEVFFVTAGISQKLK